MGSHTQARDAVLELLGTWCCRVVSLGVRPARGLVLHSLFALWTRGISFEPGRRWALELHSRALCYPASGWFGVVVA